MNNLKKQELLPDKSNVLGLVSLHLSCCVTKLSHQTVIANNLWKSLKCPNVSHNAKLNLLQSKTSELIGDTTVKL